MVNGVKGVIEPKDAVLDLLRDISPVFTIILEGIDSVSSLSIESPSAIQLISSDLHFKVMEERVGGVRRSPLDACQSG